MPIYPMIDDRNETPSSHEISDLGIWDRAGNIEAWKWYLGEGEADQYAAPARATDLAGLPPTFIDVGTVDLFRDEDIAVRHAAHAGRRPDRAARPPRRRRADASDLDTASPPCAAPWPEPARRAGAPP